MASTLAIGHRVYPTTRPTHPTPPTPPRRSRADAIATLAKHVSRNVAPRTSLGTETSTESGTTVFRAGDRTITFDASVSPIQRSAILKSLIKRRPTGTRGETMVTKGASIEAGSL